METCRVQRHRRLQFHTFIIISLGCDILCMTKAAGPSVSCPSLLLTGAVHTVSQLCAHKLLCFFATRADLKSREQKPATKLSAQFAILNSKPYDTCLRHLSLSRCTVDDPKILLLLVPASSLAPGALSFLLEHLRGRSQHLH